MSLKPATTVASSLHPVEHYYVREYLGIEVDLPYAFDIDRLFESYFQENEIPTPPHLLLNEGIGCDFSRQISNVVARLCLEAIDSKLPRFTVMDDQGVAYSARQGKGPKKAGRSIVSLPNYLFEINWATSGPGFSWEESYHVSFIAEYDRYVVTASQDSPDAMGFCDLCIGHFGATNDVVSDALEVIENWWGDKVAEYDANPYERISGLGSASIEQIENIARNVWSGDQLGL